MEKTILLVDDVQMFIDIQTEFLQESELTVSTAKNGLEAMEYLRNNRTPDLVFMDLHMPQMDGAACCGLIKTSPSLAGVPVVMVTSMGNQEDIEKSFSSGCDDFLTKPLDRNIFLAVARRFIPCVERREKRLPINVRGVFSTMNQSLECQVRDLSIGGVYIASDCRVTPRQILRIHFSLPGGHSIECSGRVAWLSGDDSTGSRPEGFGVQFALLSKKDREIISRFIEANRNR